MKLFPCVLVVVYVSIFLCMSCSLREKTPKIPTLNLKDAPDVVETQTDLNLLAVKTQFISPAPNTNIREPSVVVKFSVPENITVIDSAALLVDGVEVASIGSPPWEVLWPSYYWADDGDHLLKIKLTTGLDNPVLVFEQISVQVSSEAGSHLRALEYLNGVHLQSVDQIEIDLGVSESADRYTLVVDGPGMSFWKTQVPSVFKVSGMAPGVYSFSYRLESQIGGEWHEGPESKKAAFSILKPELPLVQVDGYNVNGEFKIDVVWQDMGEANVYEVTLLSRADLSILSSTLSFSNRAEFVNLSPGYYALQLQRTNHLGQRSVVSQLYPIDIGLVRTTFGGDGIDDLRVPIECSINSSESEITRNEYIGVSGEWDVYPNCLVGRGAGDNLILSSEIKGDFLFSAVVTVLEGSAASLVFGAKDKTTIHVTIDVDKKEILLWESGVQNSVLEVTRVTHIVRGQSYLLEVSLEDGVLEVRLNSQIVISYNDSESHFPLSGKVGANVYNSTSLFQDVSLITF